MNTDVLRILIDYERTCHQALRDGEIALSRRELNDRALDRLTDRWENAYLWIHDAVQRVMADDLHPDQPDPTHG